METDRANVPLRISGASYCTFIPKGSQIFLMPQAMTGAAEQVQVVGKIVAAFFARDDMVNL